MGLLKNIYWEDSTKNTIVYKFDIKNDYVSRGSALTVREGQAAIFCHQGKMCDVFLPGFYKLDTNSIPVITKLMSWKYGFENPFRSDIYFVKTTQFTNEKWGTQNPIILSDKNYGGIRVRGFGTYSFKVEDPFIFMQQLSGTHSSFKTQDITEYLRSMLIMGITDALGESKLSVLQMAANLMELSREVEKSLAPDFKDIGLQLVKFNFQNFSLPEEIEKALDQSTSLGMLSNNMDTYMAKAQADALSAAAKNPGMAGNIMGAGIGFGMGKSMGGVFGNIATPGAQSVGTSTGRCPSCGASVKSSAKFCPECGKPIGSVCPKCKSPVKDGAKFCPECGVSLANKGSFCSKCSAPLKVGAKFCPECGERQ